LTPAENDRTLDSSDAYLPRNERGPVFAERWHASVFALAMQLTRLGHISRAEWATALGSELRSANHGEPDDGSHYYEYFLAALEKLVTAKGLTDPAALAECALARANAVRSDPHRHPSR